MAQLNYNHLRYFYTVAKEGSIVKAAEVLHVSPQTISGQLTVFEDYLGSPLFERKGKRLILNGMGQVAISYAEDIFALGSELQQTLKSENILNPLVFTVGVVDVIPKILAFSIIQHCFELESDIKLVCREGDLETLLADVALNKIDLILSDRPLPPGMPLKAYNHHLGESGVSFYACKKDAKKLAKGFPQSLHRWPVLLSGDKSAQKIDLISWFDQFEIHPIIKAEFDDSALVKFFGQAGYGVFCSPSIIEDHILAQYEVKVIGRTNDIAEHFYAISPERKLKHPGVKLIVDAAVSLFRV